MYEPRKFPLHQILAITTGLALNDGTPGNRTADVDGLYEVLDFMTNDNLFTHALGRAKDSAAPVILQQHPQLASIDLSDITRETFFKLWPERHKALVADFGAELELVPLAYWTPKDPFTELADMGFAGKVIAIDTSPDFSGQNVDEGADGRVIIGLHEETDEQIGDLSLFESALGKDDDDDEPFSDDISEPNWY